MSRRSDFEQEWLKFLKDFGADARNTKLYETWFPTMNDEEFTDMVTAIRNKELVLPIFSYNMEGKKTDIKRVMALGERLGIKWFERMEFTDPVSGEVGLSEVKSLILRVQSRRQIQHLVKKRSAGENSKVIDYLSGQVTGSSRSGSISAPELMVLNSKGYVAAILEQIKLKGGDDEANRAMMEQLEATGSFSVEPTLALNSRPRITKSINRLLRGMMLDNNVAEDRPVQ